jgi:hypothetical protein
MRILPPSRVKFGTESQPGRDYGDRVKPKPPRLYNGLRGVRTWNQEKAWPGYTLFSPAFGDTSYLIDMNGRVVHSWPVTHSQWGELNPDGSLFWDNYFGGLFESDIDGNLVWAWHGRTHHDYHRFPGTDSILTLYQRDRDRPDIYTRGPIQDDLILQLDRDSFVHWEWWLSDHVDQLVALAGLELPRNQADWAHTNTLTVLPDNPIGRKDSRFREGNYLLSHRSLDIISIVDHESRDIVWAWGIGVLDGQHQAQMLDDGHILLFDNGTLRGHSIVREFDPREPDKMIWEYQDPPTFASPFRAGQQRLPNGNTLICESDCGRIFEVTPDKEVVWDYYSPFFGGQLVNVYRAARYAPEFVEPWLDPGILGHSQAGEYHRPTQSWMPDAPKEN